MRSDEEGGVVGRRDGEKRDVRGFEIMKEQFSFSTRSTEGL